MGAVSTLMPGGETKGCSWKPERDLAAGKGCPPGPAVLDVLPSTCGWWWGEDNNSSTYLAFHTLSPFGLYIRNPGRAKGAR